MQNNEYTTKFKCIFNLDNDGKQHNGEIEYRQGTLINLYSNLCNFHFQKHDNMQISDLDKNIMLLFDNQYCENSISSIATFDCLVKGFKCNQQIQNLKFKKINFSFPKINDFFIGIDRIDSLYFESPNQFGFKYHRTIKEIRYTLDENFSLNLIHGCCQQSGSWGGENAQIDLSKEIQIIAKHQTTLDKFLKIIRDLISFFSLGMSQKLPLLNVYSSEKNNTAKTKLEIIPFEYKILNQDYKPIKRSSEFLFCYQHIKKNFQEIFSKYIKLRSEEYQKFPVVIDLYLRNQDAPSEIYPQIKFLVYTQAIEAYLNTKEYNKDKKISKEDKSIIDKIKQQFPNIKEIQNIKDKRSCSYNEKLLNCILKNNITNIVTFNLDNDKIKLLKDLTNLRNYYTHYSTSADNKKIKNIDINELIKCTKALLELFILNELCIEPKEIKTILLNRYWRFCDIDSIYIRGLKQPNFRNIKEYIFLGSDNNHLKENYYNIHYFYRIIQDRLELMIKYQKFDIYTNKHKKRLKIFTEKIVINKILNDRDLKNLSKYFKICYNLYKEYQSLQEFKKINGI